MRLVDLSPRWIHADIFAFLCPHCWQVLLTCKRVPMDRWAQWQVIRAELGEDANKYAIGTVAQCAWQMNGNDFNTMTCTPSLDASAAGHWHGFITAGEIVGGTIKEC